MIFEQSIESSPENLRGNCFVKLGTRVLTFSDFWKVILEVHRTKIGMIIVTMPATIEPRVRIRVVNTIIRFIIDEPPFNIECR